MNVQMVLKNWKVFQDEKTKLPRLAGSFALLIGEKEIATQTFNENYGGKEIPFSSDLINQLVSFEKNIQQEMEKILT